MRLQEDWLAIGAKEDVPKPEGHYLYKCLNTVIKFEKTLKFSYILLFYLQNEHFPTWRAQQAEVEGFIAELSHEVEETDMLECARMSIADQTQKSVERFVQIESLEEKLACLQRADLSGKFIPPEEVDDPKHNIEFNARGADAGVSDGGVACPYLADPNPNPNPNWRYDVSLL